MTPDPIIRRSPRGGVLIVVFVVALFALACSDGDGEDSATDVGSTTSEAPDDTSSATTTATSTTEAPLTASSRGVTQDTIHLGFVGIDFDNLRNLGLVDINWGEFQLAVNGFVEDVNARGGINGRLVEGHVTLVSPIDLAGADTACLELTEDIGVFAVIGAFLGPASTANSCFGEQHSTILVGGAPTPDDRAKANAPWISATVGPVRHLPAAVDLMFEDGLLDGRVALAWDQTEQDVADDIVLPALAAHDVEVVRTFVQVTEGGDAVAGESEWQRISERVDIDGIDTVVLLEATAVFGANQLINFGFDGQILVVDSNSVVGAIGSSGVVSIPELAGVIGTGVSLESLEGWEQPLTQECVAMFETANPDITVTRSVLVPSGAPNYTGNIVPYCNLFRIFEMAATLAGPNLTHETFASGIEAIGELELAGGGPGSLGPGKFDAGNSLQLVVFHAEDENGGVNPYGPMVTIG